jgi:hypothetical protein
VELVFRHLKRLDEDALGHPPHRGGGMAND